MIKSIKKLVKKEKGFGHIEGMIIAVVIVSLTSIGLIVSGLNSSAASPNYYYPIGDVKLGKQPIYLYACYMKQKKSGTVKYQLVAKEIVPRRAGVKTKNTKYNFNPIAFVQVGSKQHHYDNWHTAATSSLQDEIKNGVSWQSSFRLGAESAAPKGKTKPNLQWGPVYLVQNINDCNTPAEPNIP